jgi:hypothetical protein
MYRVIEPFFDLMDDNRQYLPGEFFPREGLTVTNARIIELSTDANKLGYPVISGAEEQPRTEERKTRKRAKEDVD